MAPLIRRELRSKNRANLRLLNLFPLHAPFRVCSCSFSVCFSCHAENVLKEIMTPFALKGTKQVKFQITPHKNSLKQYTSLNVSVKPLFL